MSAQYTEKQVRELQAHMIEFIEVLNQYLSKRRAADPSFKCLGLDPGDPDENYSFDIYGEDGIVIQWRETDRCGDNEYFSVEFPLSDLWDPRWEARVQQEQEKKRRAAKRRKAEQERVNRERREQRERDELTRLQNKYGPLTHQ